MNGTNWLNKQKSVEKNKKTGKPDGKGWVLSKRWGLKLPWQRKIYRSVKDRLFRFLFENDKEALLQLYNALNGTDYTDATMMQVVTIESAVYVVMKNDLAFVLAGTLNLYEHQSTYNPNMPVRFLIYLAEEYQKLVEQAEKSLCGILCNKKLLRLFEFAKRISQLSEAQFFIMERRKNRRSRF